MSTEHGHVEVPAYPVPDPSQVIRAEAPADDWTAVRDGRRQLRADVVIVGTGPGGAAAARELARAGARVVLLEEGPSRQRFRPNQAHTARYHMQEGGLMLARGTTGFPISAGRGVGGGTLINSALSFRTPTAILDGWADRLQAPWWSAEAMALVYAEVEALSGVGITPDAVAGENNRLIALGAARMGFPGGLAPRSTPGCRGCGICNFGCPTQGKASVNLTFLPDAVEHGALIQADVRVTGVRVEGGRAIGVVGRCHHPDTRQDLGEVEVLADKVVLSAGAIGTPRLLWACGLAAQMGGAVGEGLHVHAGSAVLGLHPHEVHLWKGATQGAYFHDPALPGVLPHSFTAPPEVCLAALNRVGPRLQEGLELLPRLSGVIVLVSDESTGRVRAFADGRADITYHFGAVDLERARLGLLSSARVLFAAGAESVTAPIFGVGTHRDVEPFAAALDSRVVTDYTMYSAHPMSSCRMGVDPSTSVVDPRGRSHHIEGLYLSDASIYPSSLGVNPQLTTMAAGVVIGRAIAAGG
jgi:choline dehydrogenase-like flavoprotein